MMKESNAAISQMDFPMVVSGMWLKMALFKVSESNMVDKKRPTLLCTYDVNAEFPPHFISDRMFKKSNEQIGQHTRFLHLSHLRKSLETPMLMYPAKLALEL